MSLRLFSGLHRQVPEMERKLVKFSVGKVLCAVDIMHVREIILPREKISPLPSRDSSIIGVLDHREAAIPVVDLRARFDIRESSAPRQKWIIMAVDDISLALVVDKVFGVTRFHPNQQRDRSALGTADVSWATTVYGDRDGLIFEIDLDLLAGMVGAK
ncbi:MAG: chemotaxis protein CheW [Deltaproteobacteria bacterium]|nr:chemotaxis protein CheW [Deltaproteobacteria bacterium]